MSRVLTSERAILLWQCESWFLGRHISAPRGEEDWSPPGRRQIEILSCNIASNHLSQQAGDSVPDLTLHFRPITTHLYVGRKCLEPSELRAAKLSIAPVKRPCCRTGLSLKRPRWT